MNIKASHQIFRLTGAAGVIVSTALLLFYCKAITGRYRMYSGPVLPRSEVSVLYAKGPCYIRSVDGERVAHSWGMDAIEIHLLPGRHVVWVDCGGVRRPEADVKIDFSAQPGRTYTVKADAGYTPDGRWGWVGQIVDVTSLETDW